MPNIFFLIINVKNIFRTELQKTFVVEDLYWYSNDGTKLNGTYSTGTDGDYDYITNIKNDLLFPTVPTGDFELSMKAYRLTTSRISEIKIKAL